VITAPFVGLGAAVLDKLVVGIRTVVIDALDVTGDGGGAATEVGADGRLLLVTGAGAFWLVDGGLTREVAGTDTVELLTPLESLVWWRLQPPSHFHCS